MGALVLGHSALTSAASEAVSWYVLFGVSKNHRRKCFLGSWLKSKVAQRPRFRGTGWPQIWPPRPSEAVRGQNRFFSDFTKTVISPRIANMRKVFQRFFDLENMLFQMSIITLAAKCGNSHNRCLKIANFRPIFQPLKTDFQKSF